MNNEITLPLNIKPGIAQSHFEQLLHAAALLGASDVSIQSNDYVYFMINGVQVRATTREFQQSDVVTITNIIYGTNGASIIKQGIPIDERIEVRPNRGESFGFRVNIIPSRVDGNDEAISITMRVMPTVPPKISDLKVPTEIIENSLPRNGLIVIAGITSSGKSTLIASILRYALEVISATTVTSQGRKIATYEAPIEFVFDGVESIAPKISQTEIGSSKGGLKTWAEAVSSAMRRALSIVLIGECRDGDTINGCISMALTGQCTLTTVHANRVGVAFRRMVAMASEKGGGIDAVTERLLGSLSLIVVQTLCPKVGGGRIALREWLVVTKSIQDQMLDLPAGKSIASELQKIVVANGTSMGHSALAAYKRGEISVTDACAYSGLTKDELMGLESTMRDIPIFVEGESDAVA